MATKRGNKKPAESGEPLAPDPVPRRRKATPKPDPVDALRAQVETLQGQVAQLVSVVASGAPPDPAADRGFEVRPTEPEGLNLEAEPHGAIDEAEVELADVEADSFASPEPEPVDAEPVRAMETPVPERAPEASPDVADQVFNLMIEQVTGSVEIDVDALGLELAAALSQPAEVDWSVLAEPDDEEDVTGQEPDGEAVLAPELEAEIAAYNAQGDRPTSEDDDPVEDEVATVSADEIAALFAATDQALAGVEPGKDKEPAIMEPEANDERSIMSPEEIQALLSETPDSPAPEEEPAVVETMAVPDNVVQIGFNTIVQVEDRPSCSGAGHDRSTELQPQARALAAVPGVLAARALALPLSIQGDTLRVAVCEPVDEEAMTALSAAVGLKIERERAEMVHIVAGLREAYSARTIRAPAPGPEQPSTGPLALLDRFRRRSA